MKRVRLLERQDAYVYVVFHPEYGTPIYIGKGKGNRWMDHQKRTSNILLRRVVKKYGSDLPIVKIHERLTDVRALDYEVILIAAIGRIKDGGPLYNMTDGGDGVIGASRESIEKMRAKKIGKRWSEENRKKLSIAHTGLKHSLEHRAAISKSLRGKKYNIVNRTSNRTKQNFHFPRNPRGSESNRAAMSAAQKRRDRSAGYSDAHAKAIAKGVAAYWERRRQQGLPLTNRTEEGNRKHAAAMVASHAKRKSNLQVAS